jgi:fused signal recognition particle receptor
MISLFGKNEPEPTLLEKLKASVSKTKAALSETVDTIFLGERKIDPALLKQLETALLSADLGVRTTREILDAVREKMDRNALADASQLKREIKLHIVRILAASGSTAASPAGPLPGVAGTSPNGKGPRVIFVVGVNGAGKTTSIGKLANRLPTHFEPPPSSNWRFGRSATASRSSSRSPVPTPPPWFTTPWPLQRLAPPTH